MLRKAALAIVLASLCFGGSALAAEKPNILLIVSADDMGYGDLAPYGAGEGRGMPTPTPSDWPR
jgi:arylsulfatase